MPVLLKVAAYCGAVPLLCGTLIYASWRLTRWDSLTLAGVCAILAGLISLVVGAILLAVSVKRERRRSGALLPAVRAQAVLVASLLLINLPAAGLFTYSAIQIMTRYTIRVINESGRPIESFVVMDPGGKLELGAIQAGRRWEHHWVIRGEGALSRNDSVGKQRHRLGRL